MTIAHKNTILGDLYDMRFKKAAYSGVSWNYYCSSKEKIIVSPSRSVA
jgi:hypothetical protein